MHFDITSSLKYYIISPWQRTQRVSSCQYELVVADEKTLLFAEPQIPSPFPPWLPARRLGNSSSDCVLTSLLGPHDQRTYWRLRGEGGREREGGREGGRGRGGGRKGGRGRGEEGKRVGVREYKGEGGRERRGICREREGEGGKGKESREREEGERLGKKKVGVRERV